VQEHPDISRNWAIRILRDFRQVCVLPFEAGCQVLLKPQWACDQPTDGSEARGSTGV
jgi:hypothetical protein